MKKDKLENLIWIVFFLVGLLFFIIGSIICFGIFANREDRVETTAVIYKMVPYKNQDGGRSYNVYVKYNVESEQYESKLNAYSSNFYEGKEIEIYYDKNNPNKVGVRSLDLVFLIFPGLGLIFLIIGGSGLLVKKHKKKVIKKLKENGEIITAKYIQTLINTSYWVNGRCPYRIICSFDNPEDGKTYMFESENIWINPETIIEDKNIETFNVYINPNNKKQYFVDTAVLTDNVVDLTK